MGRYWLGRILLAAAAVLLAAGCVLLPVSGEGARGEPAPPAGLGVLQRPEDAGRRIALTWEVQPGDFAYQVYRSESEDGPYLQVGGKAADSMGEYPVFLDEEVEPGITYYYRVSRLNEGWEEGPLSPPVAARLEFAYRAAVGAKRMVISLTDQRIYFYEGDQLVNIMRCSTGVRPGSTPTGNFRVLGHYRTHGGLGGVTCDYWMSFTSAHGIHSWPRGNSRYEEGLGAVASHGCVRLHPAEAYWPYNWAPNGTPIHITHASFSRRVINGCHSTVGAVDASTEWFFAEGYTAEDFDTWLLLANPGPRATTAHVEFLLEGGGTAPFDFPLPSLSRHTVPVDALPGLEQAAFSMRVSAGEPVVAERAMYFRKGHTDGGHVTVGADSPSTEWHFAEGCTRDFFESYLLLGNPGDEVASVDVDFFLASENLRYTFMLAARSRVTVPIHSLPGLDYQDMAISLRSSVPVVAERSQYYSLDSHRGGHATMGSARPSARWHFAEGYTGEAYDTWLLLSNPGGDAANVIVSFYREGQGPIDHYFAIAPFRRVTVHADELPGLEEASFSMTVGSDVPVVAERAMYFVIPRGY